eukprot:7651496-Karenia_brevis.AAC.1
MMIHQATSTCYPAFQPSPTFLLWRHAFVLLSYAHPASSAVAHTVEAWTTTSAFATNCDHADHSRSGFQVPSGRLAF